MSASYPVLRVFRNEIGQVCSQLRVRVLTGLLVVTPWVFLLLLLNQERLPTETLHGRLLRTTGFATPVVLLVVATQWVFPLLASFVSGDIFSAEDARGTWKTLLTRSVSRSAIFWGKVLSAAVITAGFVVVLAGSSLAAGLLLVGSEPLVSIGATSIPADRAVLLVLTAWASVLPPVLGFAALAVCISVVTRSSVLGVLGPVVVGVLCQAYQFVNASDTVRHLLPNAPMHAWRGLLDVPSYAAPLVSGLVVSAAYVLVPLTIAYVVFRRRDVVGG